MVVRGVTAPRAVAVALAVMAGCATTGTESSTPRRDPRAGPAIGVRTETFVDSSRPTEPMDLTGPAGATPTRTLRTLIYYPVDQKPRPGPGDNAPAPPAPGGPFPLVIFAHGYTVSDPATYSTLLQTWAAAGYVVAAPTFPLSSTRKPGGLEDLANQPADVSFVLTQLLDLAKVPGGPYNGLIDPARVAMAGHSLGAMTTLGVTANTCCTDDRFKAAVVLAGEERSFPDGSFFPPGPHIPIMVVHGQADTTVPLDNGRKVFADAGTPKVMLTIVSGDHVIPYAGDGQNSQTRLVATATLDFLDRYVGGRVDGLVRLGKAVAADRHDGLLEVVGAA